MKTKLINSIKDVISAVELKSGMTVSFHHHLRNGDYVLNAVMEEISKAGLTDMCVAASSLFDSHAPLISHIENGVVTQIETDYMGSVLGKAISRGIMEKPVNFRTHGGRPAAMESGKIAVDVAFIAAPTADCMGNCTGKIGKSACGSLGYAMADAKYAKKVVVITDNLVSYPLTDVSIDETNVDYVVCIDSIGDPSGIVSGTTKITRDPVGLLMADMTASAISASGLLKEGMSFQTGAGGASLAVAKCLTEIMVKEKIVGSFGLGGITGYMVDMLNKGCFEALMDVQCFDLAAVESIRSNPRHREISAMQYASPTAKSSASDMLDVVILGATEIDRNFNVNVHTDSNGYIMGGSGGHSDTAFGAKLSIIIAPLVRARLSVVTDRVKCISTPGSSIDMLVTQHGIAVNTSIPKNVELAQRLIDNNLKVCSIDELKEVAEKLTGVQKKVSSGEKVVANVVYRDESIIDTIKAVVEK